MTRRTGREIETLRISAETAKVLLGKLAEERKKLDTRMAVLQAIVDGYEIVSGKRKTESDAATVVEGKKRAPKGQVFKHVEEILRTGEHDEPSLRKAIQDKFGVAYGRATVYTCLRRGARDHKFVQDVKKWSLNPLRVSNVA